MYGAGCRVQGVGCRVKDEGNEHLRMLDLDDSAIGPDVDPPPLSHSKRLQIRFAKSRFPHKSVNSSL